MQILIQSCHSEDWFGGTTTYTVVSELDDPTWPCIECLPKVVSDFVVEQSRVHILPISAKWKHKSSIHFDFITFNGGVTTVFAKSVLVVIYLSGCPVYFREPHWKSTGLLEVSDVAWQTYLLYVYTGAIGLSVAALSSKMAP